jgi:hypothetical protein
LLDNERRNSPFPHIIDFGCSFAPEIDWIRTQGLGTFMCFIGGLRVNYLLFGVKKRLTKPAQYGSL